MAAISSKHELVVPDGLVEYPPFPGNLKICSSNHGGGILRSVTSDDPDVI
jgi:hypothetical protein